MKNFMGNIHNNYVKKYLWYMVFLNFNSFLQTVAAVFQKIDKQCLWNYFIFNSICFF